MWICQRASSAAGSRSESAAAPAEFGLAGFALAEFEPAGFCGCRKGAIGEIGRIDLPAADRHLLPADCSRNARRRPPVDPAAQPREGDALLHPQFSRRQMAIGYSRRMKLQRCSAPEKSPCSKRRRPGDRPLDRRRSSGNSGWPACGASPARRPAARRPGSRRNSVRISVRNSARGSECWPKVAGR